MFSELRCYVEFDWQAYVENGIEYFKGLNSVVNLAKMHNCTLFYSKKQLKEFVEQCKDLDQNFSKSVGNRIDVIIENTNASSIDEFYIYKIEYAKENSYIELANLNIIKAIKKNDRNIVILNLTREELSQKYLRLSETEEDLLEINFLSNPESLVSFFSSKFDKRNFNLSPKHGENGMGHWKGESPLLCNRQEAQVLLNKSIGDFNEKSRLFYFDNNHNAYIEFFFEGDNPQKQWHGFHIYENDWNLRVPNEVKKFFNRY